MEIRIRERGAPTGLGVNTGLPRKCVSQALDRFGAQVAWIDLRFRRRLPPMRSDVHLCVHLRDGAVVDERAKGARSVFAGIGDAADRARRQLCERAGARRIRRSA